MYSAASVFTCSPAFRVLLATPRLRASNSGDYTAPTALELRTRRALAIHIDRTLGPHAHRDAPGPLELWQGLVQGHWSVLDAFEVDGRQFVLTTRNSNRPEDCRGLTRKEREVAYYAALGESQKVTAYRMGRSRSWVSCLRRSAMRKLGVKSQAQLVLLMCCLLGPAWRDSGCLPDSKRSARARRQYRRASTHWIEETVE